MHPTATDVFTGEASVTVGWSGAVLHSLTTPSELSANPLPDTATLCPLVRPAEGLTDTTADITPGAPPPAVAMIGDMGEPGGPVDTMPERSVLLG